MGERLQAHLSLRWGDVILSSTSTPAVRGFVLGRGGDWPLPPEVLGAERFELLRPHDGHGAGVVLAVPPGATAWVDGQTSPFRPSTEHRLRAGGRGRVDLGSSVSVEIQVGPAPERLKGLALGASALGHQALSAAFHAGVLALLALMVPPLDPDTLDAEQYADHVAYLVRALDGTAAHASDSVGSTPEDGETAPGNDDARSKGDTSAPARREDPRGGSAQATAPRGPIAPRVDPDGTRETTLRDAASFGMIGLLPARASTGGVGWGRDGDPHGPAAAAPASALAGMFSSGLFLPSDDGFGSGGSAGITGFSIFDSVGGPTVARAGSGMASAGRLGGAHTVRAPRVTSCGGLVVSGRLPPETIQRIVHQSFGRFRGCYERELERDPSLEARVETKFLIARDGSVAMARSQGPEPLAACVQAGFASLSFPEPAGGTVIVDYPLLLQPDYVPAPTPDVER